MMEISNIQPVGFPLDGKVLQPSADNTPTVCPELLAHFRQMMEEPDYAAFSAPRKQQDAPENTGVMTTSRRSSIPQDFAVLTPPAAIDTAAAPAVTSSSVVTTPMVSSFDGNTVAAPAAKPENAGVTTTARRRKNTPTQ